MHHLRLYSLASLIFIGGFFLSTPAAHAATMPAFSYTISNPVKGATATYTFSFTTATLVPVAPDAILEAQFPTGFAVNDAANISVTVDGVPQTIDNSAFLGSLLLLARITSAVPAGSHVVVAVANVVNPSAAGNYSFPSTFYSTDDQGTAIDTPASIAPAAILNALPTYTLNYAAGAHGTLTGTSPQTITQGGNATAVTAVPATGYHFTGWSDASSTNPRTDTNVITNATLTASFAIDTHTVTYAAGAGGTLTGTASQTVNYGGSATAVTAVPDSGFEFTGWSDASTTNPRTDTNVVSDLSITAQFTAIPVVVEHHSSSSHKSGGSVQSQVNNLVANGDAAAADALKAQWPTLFTGAAAMVPASAVSTGATVSSGVSATGVRDLELGMSGEDVRSLQKLLNANGATLATSGTGSAGNETDFFGALTQHALAAYQAAHGITPSAGYFGSMTRAQMKSAGLASLWW